MEKIKVSLFETKLPAGFPSAAEDSVERKLDLHELLVERPTATFFIRVEGDSMREAGIQSGDLLVVDRSLNAKHGSIVVALLNGAFTVKRLSIVEGHLELLSENPKYPSIKVSGDFQVWGVVSYVIHKCF